MCGRDKPHRERRDRALKSMIDSHQKGLLHLPGHGFTSLRAILRQQILFYRGAVRPARALRPPPAGYTAPPRSWPDVKSTFAISMDPFCAKRQS
ncbi:hypothetical protein EVAR_38599_1 [Eumeta japonica]|uniref:Uncharacterized protein n=1 Tax=Eumeta variegata TaxID=151549 RepID=A0A4C1WU01_EUMVA|nr:hypothetical protein EVAR_38599_1 [Eumeta japonica]